MLSRFLTALAVVGLCSIVCAQVPATAPALGYDDSFQMDMFPNSAVIGDGLLIVSNSGFHANPAFPVTTSDICVNAYVFNVDASMQTCCNCRVNANALRGIIGLLPTGTAANPNIMVKLTATLPRRVNTTTTQCDPPTVQANSSLGIPGGFASGMRAWSVTFSSLIVVPFGIDKVEFAKSPLGSNEYSRITRQCALLGPSVPPCQCLAATDFFGGIPGFSTFSPPR